MTIKLANDDTSKYNGMLFIREHFFELFLEHDHLVNIQIFKKFPIIPTANIIIPDIIIILCAML
jgi:hypothetical protein